MPSSAWASIKTDVQISQFNLISPNFPRVNTSLPNFPIIAEGEEEEQKIFSPYFSYYWAFALRL